ncbi:MAG: LruC domain-containing protein [Byssovorax sp.]
MKRTPRTLTALGAFAVLGAAALVRMDTPANAYPFPCNANTTMAVYVPSSSAHGTLMLEDQWPGYGDLDFNDAVVSYQYSLAYNSSGNLVQLVGTYNVLAAGSGHANGFALHLPIPKANVSSVTLQLGNGAPAALAPRAAESELVVDVLPNLKAAFNAANDGHQINTDPAAAVLPGATYRLVVTLSTPTALSAAGAPFDAFFYWSQAPSHEIHRPGFAGTSAMDGSLFGTLQDGSTGARHFVDNRGIPYVLDVPQGIKWSKESVDISGGYSQLAAFGQSGGTSNQSWYQSPTNASLFTSGQGGAQPPSASFIGGDGAYSVDGTCNLCIANNVTCPAAPDQCHDQGTCAPMTGVCSAPPAKANGTACNDGDATTSGDQCTNGTCAPTATCNDGIQNQGEGGVDCGGPCAAALAASPSSTKDRSARRPSSTADRSTPPTRLRRRTGSSAAGAASSIGVSQGLDAGAVLTGGNIGGGLRVRSPSKRGLHHRRLSRLRHLRPPGQLRDRCGRVRCVQLQELRPRLHRLHARIHRSGRVLHDLPVGEHLHHVVLQRDASNNLSFYLDGVKRAYQLEQRAVERELLACPTEAGIFSSAGVATYAIGGTPSGGRRGVQRAALLQRLPDELRISRFAQYGGNSFAVLSARSSPAWATNNGSWRRPPRSRARRSTRITRRRATDLLA